MHRFILSIFLRFAAISWFCNCLVLAEVITCSGIVPMKYRNDKISITDFGGVGDGRTLNTKAFREAIYRIEHLRRIGGTLLYIPPGVYLTESFNLTSHMTLYLAEGAVIKATQDIRNWTLIDPLPSYGRGRELPGGRYMSFIHGDGLRDVIITGENGTIDGQGDVWWNMWRQRTLQFTRPNLVEFMNSKSIIISNVIFKNSPFWNIHPVYCSNVVIRYVTILAPPDSPNTDGIDPDSSSHVCIEDSFISTGDDLVAVKSGWDEYGIAYGRPSNAITIRRITGSSPFAGIAVGSETSGGVENVLAEHINLFNMGVGIHLKTNIGRGGVIKNITVSDVYMENVRKGIKIAGDVGDHPDNEFSPDALPVVKGVTIKNVWGEKIRQPGSIQGLRDSPFTGICLSNIHLHGVTEPRTTPWTCSDVSGAALQVSPWPCSELSSTHNTGARDLGHTALDWNQRLMIILHIARAIAFIHSQSPPRDKHLEINVHGNIRASNIMINIDFTARLSDYGFTQLAERVETSNIWHQKEPPSPENLYCAMLCQESDIYNFGMILLDILGGPKVARFKKCIAERKEEIKVGIHEFFEFFVEGKERNQALQVLDIALACTNRAPDARPSIDLILLYLEDIFTSNKK